MAAATARAGGGVQAVRAAARHFEVTGQPAVFIVPRDLEFGPLPPVRTVPTGWLRGLVAEMWGCGGREVPYIGMSDRLPLRPRRSLAVMVAQNPHLYGPPQVAGAMHGRLPRLRNAAQRLRLTVLRAWAHRSARSADCVVVATEQMRDLVAEAGAERERIVVRPIPPQDISINKSDHADEFRSIVMIGTVYGYKQFDWALCQLEEWCAERDRQLEVTHAGGPIDTLRAVADRCPHLTCNFVGPATHETTLGLLAAADLFLFPSERESFGIPLAEALAVGVPALCNDLPVFREIAGDAALYFDSPMHFRVALDAMRDRAMREHLADRGRARVVANIGWDVLSPPPARLDVGSER